MRNTTHIHTTLSSSATTPARVWGPPEYHRVARTVQGHFAPVDSAHPQLEFRPGSSLFARRYWGNLFLISFPGLTDMLKFGPWSRAAQVRLNCFCRPEGFRPAEPTLYRTRHCCLRYSRIDNSHRAEARRHQFRSVLRSSSMSKPRDPLLLVRFLEFCLICSLADTSVGTNDPAAGSPTAALLRLLLPPDIGVRRTSPLHCCCRSEQLTKTSESVGATGGVYKRQGRSRRALMKHTYKTFLVHGGQFQPPIPTTAAFQTDSRASRPSNGLAPPL